MGLRPRRLPIAVVAGWLGLVGGGAAGHAAQPIRFDQLGTRDGLSQATVFAIHQDSRGLLWFGTEDGLNRYDGYEFEVFKHDRQDPESLSSSFIFSLDEDAEGNLWIGTDGGGLARWDRQTGAFSTLTGPGGADAPSAKIRIVETGPTGKIWIGTRDVGLLRYDPETGGFKSFPHDPEDPESLPHPAVFAIHFDDEGRLWVGTDGGLSRWIPGTQRFENHQADAATADSLSDSRVRAILAEPDGTVWVGTYGGGLNRLRNDGSGFDHYRHDPRRPTSLSHDQVRSILRDRTGGIWVGTSDGLDRFDPRTDGFSHYTHDPTERESLSDSHVKSLFQDRSGVIWAGTLAGGINRWDPTSWSFGHERAEPPATTGLANDHVAAFAEDGEGMMWVGSLGGLDRFDPTTGEYLESLRREPGRANGLTDERIMSLRIDHRGLLWIGTMTGGLHRLDLDTRRMKVFSHDPNDEQTIGADGIMTIYEDLSGGLWIGTFGGGLSRYDRATESFERFRHDPDEPRSISSDRVTAIVEDDAGYLWIGTDGGGLNRFDRRAGEFQRFEHDPNDPASISAASVLTLHYESPGVIWAGTRGGLDRITNRGEEVRYENYSERNGLPSAVVYGIVPDDDGALWLSTNNGLVRFQPETGAMHIYTKSHGLQADEFNFGAAARSRSGELYFGGVSGFNHFRPEAVGRRTEGPAVVLTAVLLFNERIDELGPAAEIRELDLDYRDDVVTFEFAALDFAAPRENRYAYRLEGFDDGWVESGPVRRATYTNLDAGEYVFHVRAASRDGVWTETPLALPLRVAAAPWATWWAYALYGLLLSGIVFAFIRHQRAKVEREARYSRRLEEEVRLRSEELVKRASELEEANEKLVKASLTDPLTGLANRRYLREFIGSETALVRRKLQDLRAGDGATPPPLDLYFVMVDLDDFKPINDTYGHSAGDAVITGIRDILVSLVRTSDVVVRWGGDEFLIVGRGSAPEGLPIFAERIRSTIEMAQLSIGQGRTVRTTCSIGFACYPFLPDRPDLLTWENVISIADRALYVAKRTSRNTWFGFRGVPGRADETIVADLWSDPKKLVDEGLVEIVSPEANLSTCVWT